MRNSRSAAESLSIPVEERVSRLRAALVPLRVLDANLREARAMVAEQRRDPRGPWGAGPPSARQAMLLALEAYADGLAARRLPVPYLLRDELRLHQRLYGEPAPRGGAAREVAL